MTKNGLGTLIESGTLRMERTLPAPIERVWAYFVESDVLDDVLHRRKPRGFWTRHAELEKAYEAHLPA